MTPRDDEIPPCGIEPSPEMDRLAHAVIDGMLVVELEAIEQIGPVHRLQARTYMRPLGQPLALVINFNVPVLKEGIRRVVQTS